MERKERREKEKVERGSWRGGEGVKGEWERERERERGRDRPRGIRVGCTC